MSHSFPGGLQNGQRSRHFTFHLSTLLSAKLLTELAIVIRNTGLWQNLSTHSQCDPEPCPIPPLRILTPLKMLF